MKPISTWIAPCLVVSVYFAEFTPLRADTPAPEQVRAPAAARPGPAAPAHAEGPRPAAPAGPREGPREQEPRREVPTPAREAPRPQAAEERTQANKEAAAESHAREQAAAQHAQAERAAENQQRGAEKAAAEQNAARRREVEAPERAAEGPRNAENQRGAEKAAEEQNAARRRETVTPERAAAQERAVQDQRAAEERRTENAQNADGARAAAQERMREAENQRKETTEQQRETLQNRAAENQERLKEAQDRNRENAGNAQDRVREAQERARENAGAAQERARENVGDAQERMREAQERNRQNLNDRAAENQDRLREAQDRNRENVANNQERLRDAQARAREAQDNLRSRVNQNVEQRREAYQNARQLAAEARRPLLERPDVAFRPELGEIRRDPSWQSRWGNWGVVGASALRANRIEGERAALAANYERSMNWSYQPSYWGSRPWWNAGSNYQWYSGSWNYGWNRNWYGRHSWYAPQAWPGYVVENEGNGVAWGLAAWGLGSLIYNSGYELYSNPYAPDAYSYGGTTIDYREPFTTIAANYPTGDEERSKTSAEKSSAALDRSRDAFRNGDYVTALKANDEAISYEPGDSTLHEYRALILFALGRYGDSAGVLNSILASSPGWDWKTMLAFYPDQQTYDDQLAKLEQYANGKRDAADARFVLGYHYMVAGNLDGAGREFDQVVALQPRDTIAKQLRDLVRSSVKDPRSTQASEPVEGADRTDREAIDPSRLVGTWSTDRGNGGSVTLRLEDGGNFDWKFDRDGGKDSEMKGTYSIDDRGLLVLKSDTSQMVGEIHMPEDRKLNFVLAGGPEGDPGLNFNRN